LAYHFWKGLSTPVIIAILSVIILVSISTGLLNVSRTIPSSGTVVVSNPNLAVFSDSQCTQALTSLDWGSVSSGSSVTKTIYIKNTGDVALTLSMTTSSWSPVAASDSMSILWDKQSSILAANQTTAAILRLSVSTSISGITAFSVNVVITGTG
jgi:hypothetical protein